MSLEREKKEKEIPVKLSTGLSTGYPHFTKSFLYSLQLSVFKVIHTFNISNKTIFRTKKKEKRENLNFFIKKIIDEEINIESYKDIAVLICPYVYLLHDLRGVKL